MSETQDCPYCFRKIKTSSRFCKFCGSTLKLCPECKTLNKDDASYCDECGSDIKDVEVAESYKIMKGEISAQDEEEIQDFLEEGGFKSKKPQLIVWPPLADSRHQPQVSSRPRPYSQLNYLEREPTYQPTDLKYTYSKVKPLGFLGGSIPTSNFLGAIIEAFGLALALIALGIVIFAIGMAFFQYLIFPIIAGIIAGAFLLSAPFFGIYYVSSKWLYRAFDVKRPVKTMTIIGNYTLGSLIFALLGMMLAPIFIQGGAVSITLSVVGGIVYIMGLIIIPLKAYLADLIYVRAAVNEKKNEEK